MLGKIANGKMQSNEYGRVAEDELLNTAEIRERLTIDCYVIMPNHIHFIAIVGEPLPVGAAGAPPETLIKPLASPKNTQFIPKIVQEYKAAVTRKIGFSLWHRSYYDNIIRDDDQLEIIRHYIKTNPATWEKDRFFCKL